MSSNVIPQLLVICSMKYMLRLTAPCISDQPISSMIGSENSSCMSIAGVVNAKLLSDSQIDIGREQRVS